MSKNIMFKPFLLIFLLVFPLSSHAFVVPVAQVVFNSVIASAVTAHTNKSVTVGSSTANVRTSGGSIRVKLLDVAGNILPWAAVFLASLGLSDQVVVNGTCIVATAGYSTPYYSSDYGTCEADSIAHVASLNASAINGAKYIYDGAFPRGNTGQTYFKISGSNSAGLVYDLGSGWFQPTSTTVQTPVDQLPSYISGLDSFAQDQLANDLLNAAPSGDVTAYLTPNVITGEILDSNGIPVGVIVSSSGVTIGGQSIVDTNPDPDIFEGLWTDSSGVQYYVSVDENGNLLVGDKVVSPPGTLSPLPQGQKNPGQKVTVNPDGSTTTIKEMIDALGNIITTTITRAPDGTIIDQSVTTSSGQSSSQTQADLNSQAQIDKIEDTKGRLRTRSNDIGGLLSTKLSSLNGNSGDRNTAITLHNYSNGAVIYSGDFGVIAEDVGLAQYYRFIMGFLGALISFAYVLYSIL